jgi:hypothetical protein
MSPLSLAAGDAEDAQVIVYDDQFVSSFKLQ